MAPNDALARSDGTIATPEHTWWPLTADQGGDNMCERFFCRMLRTYLVRCPMLEVSLFVVGTVLCLAIGSLLMLKRPPPLMPQVPKCSRLVSVSRKCCNIRHAPCVGPSVLGMEESSR